VQPYLEASFSSFMTKPYLENSIYFTLPQNQVEKLCYKHHIRNTLYSQNYCFFWTLLSSGILGTRKHDVLESGSASVLRCGGKTPEADPLSKMSCFLVPRIPDDGKSKKPSNSECYTPPSEPFRIYIIVGPFRLISL
jgi:hypothetical protein